MPQPYAELAAELLELETIMRRDGLWHHKSPSLEALGSTMPFSVDTLEFTDWLQFIFIPRMQAIIQQQSVLPEACSIAPAAEVALMGRSQVKPLIIQLQRLDTLFVRARVI